MNPLSVSCPACSYSASTQSAYTQGGYQAQQPAYGGQQQSAYAQGPPQQPPSTAYPPPSNGSYSQPQYSQPQGGYDQSGPYGEQLGYATVNCFHSLIIVLISETVYKLLDQVFHIFSCAATSCRWLWSGRCERGLRRLSAASTWRLPRGRGRS